MSVLVDAEILRALDQGSMIIEPFDLRALGTNSYDVHLAPKLLTYETLLVPRRASDPNVIGGPQWIESVDAPLDVRQKRGTVEHLIPDEGFVLQPGELYLASTIEYTESHKHLPLLNGKSSIGRLGLSIHVTAGTGDVGFRGHWTMELFVIKPLRVYAGMAIGQLLWLTTNEPPDVPYDLKKSAKYNNHDPLPQASRMHQEHTSAESKE